MGKRTRRQERRADTDEGLQLVGKTDPVTGEIVPFTDDDLLELVRRDPKTGQPVPGALAELKRQRAAMWGDKS